MDRRGFLGVIGAGAAWLATRGREEDLLPSPVAVSEEDHVARLTYGDTVSNALAERVEFVGAGRHMSVDIGGVTYRFPVYESP